MHLKFAAALSLLTTFAITNVRAGVVATSGSPYNSETVLRSGTVQPCHMDTQACEAVKLPDLSNAAAVWNAGKTTRIYYQTPDGAIWEAGGVGAPGECYPKGVILPAGKARVYTPIAVTADPDFNFIFLYYIRLDGYLGEWVYRHGGWAEGGGGGLDTLKFSALVRSSYLYALSDIGSSGESELRVGFLDENGITSEAYHPKGGPWRVVKL